MILRELRERFVPKKNLDQLDEELGTKQRKWYIERKYKSMKFFKYLLFIRSKGANINKFLDDHLENRSDEK
ncbi:MAG: hypothetical protein RL662_2189 [Bacteroidota bacterium]|jgi:hypothetical protein